MKMPIKGMALRRSRKTKSKRMMMTVRERVIQLNSLKVFWKMVMGLVVRGFSAAAAKKALIFSMESGKNWVRTELL